MSCRSTSLGEFPMADPHHFFLTLGCGHMVPTVIGRYVSFPLDDSEKRKMLHFQLVAIEQVWWHRNAVWKGQSIPCWSKVSATCNQLCRRYWRASLTRQQKECRPVLLQWQPPVEGELKFNFDAAFKDGRAVTGCILRNATGIILGAWTNRFDSDNPYCAEAEAAL